MLHLTETTDCVFRPGMSNSLIWCVYGNQRKDRQFDLETGDWITQFQQITRLIKARDRLHRLSLMSTQRIFKKHSEHLRERESISAGCFIYTTPHTDTGRATLLGFLIRKGLLEALFWYLITLLCGQFSSSEISLCSFFIINHSYKQTSFQWISEFKRIMGK